MIQRIQTLFLLGAALCMGMVLAYPVWYETAPDDSQGIMMTAIDMQVIDLAGTPQDRTDDTVIEKKSLWYLTLPLALSILVSFFSIFQFKNRLNQIKLGALNSLLIVVFLGLSLYKVSGFESIVNPDAPGNTHPLSYFLPVAALVLNAIANRFIRKDEKLVKSVDRIR